MNWFFNVIWNIGPGTIVISIIYMVFFYIILRRHLVEFHARNDNILDIANFNRIVEAAAELPEFDDLISEDESSEEVADWMDDIVYHNPYPMNDYDDDEDNPGTLFFDYNLLLKPREE